jgi:N6-adenosine-specific RNA methylase IME4
MKIHPAAEIFPMLSDEELDSLAVDIKTHGLRHPLVMHDRELLDGRNRLAACKIAGVVPSFVEYEGDSPVSFVISVNIKRRQLDASQRACVAVEIEPMFAVEAKKRQVRKSVDSVVANLPQQKPDKAKARDQAADVVSVSPRMVQYAKEIKAKNPEAFERVKSGEVTVNEVQREIKKKDHALLVEKVKREPPKIIGVAELILADPPWKYDHQQASNRDIENHYPTASIEEICKHVPNVADDSILFLWATAPKLVEALQVMEAWGFNYRTHAIWDKEKQGMGYWFRGQHELLLVGVRGNPGCTPEPARVSSVFRSARGRHSEKPICVYEWIELAFPQLLKLEMYCRTPRKGWQVWGNEI